MLKYHISKYGSIAGLAVMSLHYGLVYGYHADQWIAGRIGAAKSGLIDVAAERLGYERLREAEPEVSNRDYLIATCRAQSVNPSVCLALMHHESRGNPEAVSKVGAIGLMQIMPANAKRCGVKAVELLEPKTNIACGVKILAEEHRKYRDISTAIQVYNGGPQCVNRCKESIELARNVVATAVNTPL